MHGACREEKEVGPIEWTRRAFVIQDIWKCKRRAWVVWGVLNVRGIHELCRIRLHSL